MQELPQIQRWADYERSPADRRRCSETDQRLRKPNLKYSKPKIVSMRYYFGQSWQRTERVYHLGYRFTTSRATRRERRRHD